MLYSLKQCWNIIYRMTSQTCGGIITYNIFEQRIDSLMQNKRESITQVLELRYGSDVSIYNATQEIIDVSNSMILLFDKE